MHSKVAASRQTKREVPFAALKIITADDENTSHDELFIRGSAPTPRRMKNESLPCLLEVAQLHAYNKDTVKN